MKKFCTSCGAKITDESNFCLQCGTKIETEQIIKKQLTQPEPQVTPDAPPPASPAQPVATIPIQPQPTQPMPPPQSVAPTYVSSPTLKSKSLKYLGVIAVVAILIIASFYVGFKIGAEDSKETGDSRKVSISTGNNIPAASGSVGYDGGEIKVTDSSSPLYGFNIDVPKAATEDSVNFEISYSDITDITGLPDNTNFASKMITIETDGTAVWDTYKSFEKPCLVTLPYDPSLVTNEKAIRFYSYDDENNRLEATGFISQDTDANTITFYAGTFSNFTAIELMMAAYEWFGADYAADTEFRPSKDGWFIDNWGSYLRSGGVCLGMTSYAKWYYAHKKSTAGNLYTKYREGDDAEWRDDETAVELATRCQMGSSGIWSSLNGDEREWATTKSEDVAYSLIHGMTVSGEPQLVGLRTRYVNGSWAAGGHAVLAYQYSGGRFDIYDPNYHGTAPGTDVRQIPFTYNDGFTRVYSSGQNAGSGRQYNIFYHASSKTFSPANAYSQLFDGAEKQFKDDSIFPTVTLTSPDTPIDTDGDDIRDTTESKVTISGTITGGQKAVSSTLIFVSNQKFIVPVNGGSFSQEVPLFAGENDVIILATDENTRTNWAGFLKDSIKSSASVASLTFTLTWGQGNSDVDLHVLEPTISNTDGRHIYYNNMGSQYNDYPYLDIDNTDGYGPEHYYATEDMTLPNYAGSGKSLYGTYKFRVHYYADHDSDDENTQPITWQVSVGYLAFKDEITGEEYWEENSWNGALATASSYSTSSFYNSGSSWDTIYEVEYLQPDPDDYGVPPPPQNELPG